MSVLTCINCRETFSTSEEQRDHYHSDYHRFNAKRKMLDLPPVSQEVYAQKVEELRVKQNTKEVFTGHCLFCKKTFSNQRTYNNHVKSKKHIEKEKLARTTGETASGLVASFKTLEVSPPDQPEETKLEGQQSLPQTEEEVLQQKMARAHRFDLDECLFCCQKFASFSLSVEHMTKHHGFFIPDIEYLTDLEGLISYLGEKIGTGNVCVHCDKMFSDTDAVQNHMTSLSHAKFPADDMGEFDEFYDFSASWESEGENAEESAPVDDLQLIARTGKGIIDVTDDGFTLTLASGRRIGHRELSIYYKQNYRRHERDPKVLNSTINTYKALGWHTKASTEAERRARANHIRRHQKQYAEVGIKANKLQRYYREQVMC